MIAQIAAKLFDLSGYVLLHVLPNNPQPVIARRFNKTRTLYGGVSVNERGFSQADREISISYANQTTEVDAALDRLVRLHSRVYLSTNDGFFEAVPVSLDRDQDRPTITLSILDKIEATVVAEEEEEEV